MIIVLNINAPSKSLIIFINITTTGRYCQTNNAEIREHSAFIEEDRLKMKSDAVWHRIFKADLIPHKNNTVS